MGENAGAVQYFEEREDSTLIIKLAYKKLYVKAGFHAIGEIEAASGVYLTQFEKILN